MKDSRSDVKLHNHSLTLATYHEHSLNDDSFLPNVGADFDVCQSGQVQHEVGEHAAQQNDVGVCADDPSSTLNSWCNPGSWQRSIMNMEANRRYVVSLHVIGLNVDGP